MFAYIKFLYDDICLNRIIVLPDSDVAVISLYQGVNNFRFLDALWFKSGTGDDIYLYTRINFRNRITNMLLASCNACRMWLRKQFFIYDSILNIKKQNWWTDKYDQLWWFPSLSLVRLNYDIECLPKRIWAEIIHHQL